MYYVCLEDNRVINILNYEPNVPSAVTVISITDQEYDSIINQTHIFDITTKKVVENREYSLENKEQEIKNGLEREFLNSTDWMILRHLREKYLDLPTTLSENKFLELEQSRQAAASRVV
jgi:hypothetical protein